MDYPAKFAVTTPEKVGRWRVLVHWLLIIPHLVIVIVLQSVGSALWTVSWLVGIFTGKMPEGVARAYVSYYRYVNRVSAYLFVLTNVYPPADWSSADADPGGYTATTNITVQLEGHNRMSILFRPILIIPAVIYFVVVKVISIFALIIMFFVLLFTGRWPDGFRRFIVGVHNVELRFDVYLSFLTDRYPPFKLNI